MKKTALFISFVLVLLISLQSCVKDPGFPIEPSIEYKSLDKTQVIDGESVKVFLEFKDGDGDLGKNPNVSGPTTCVTDTVIMGTDTTYVDVNYCDSLDFQSRCFNDPVMGVYIRDMRDGCYTFPYSLPDLEPDGEVKDIEGEIELRIVQVRCKTTSPTDTVFYEILVKDQAQHFSNPVYTDMIIITCD
ncbi:MAG: hypothetical protein ACPG4Z_07625 [Chitinophagales bacterium]